MRHPGLQRVLFDEAAIAARLDEMAAGITAFYDGKPLTVLAILNGSLIFAADLLRRLPIPLRFESLGAASYRGAVSGGTVTFKGGLPPLAGRHALILDDILDTGCTLHAVRRKVLAEGGPLSVRTAVLLRKRKTRIEPFHAEYAGFEIDDEFVVGYGLDYDGRYRNLPVIGVLDPARRGGG